MRIGIAALLFTCACGILGFTSAEKKWSIEGRCVLTDSCNAPCPGYFGQPLTNGHCAFVGILHIDHGEYDGVKLDNANVGYTGDFQEKCAPAGGNPGYAWTTYYLDVATSPAQKDALHKLFNEPMLANEWGKPTSFVEAPITLVNFDSFGQVDQPCGGRIGDVAAIRVTPLAGASKKDKPIVIGNSAHRFFDNVILSKSSSSFYKSGERDFKLDGTSGECSHFRAAGGN